MDGLTYAFRVCRTCAALASLLAIAASNSLAEVPHEPPGDLVCEKLLEEYILKRGKIESANIDAAIQLIASRGRENGFWRVVVARFEESPVNASRGSRSAMLLKILTRMLERDGHARWLFAHSEDMKRSAWVANVALPGAIIDIIVSRAKQADRNNLDDYILALVAAHDPKTRDFLREILDREEDADDLFDSAEEASQPSEPLTDASKFYAAIGLAELGDLRGVQWIVEAPTGGSLFPSYVSHVDSSGDFLQSRILALTDLTGKPFKTIEEAQGWWVTSKPTAVEFKPKSRVRLRYP